MILVNELRGIIVARGLTQQKVASELGISSKTFYLKMKKGVFNSNEIEEICKLLDIRNPSDIFFAPCVSSEETHS